TREVPEPRARLQFPLKQRLSTPLSLGNIGIPGTPGASGIQRTASLAGIAYLPAQSARAEGKPCDAYAKPGIGSAEAARSTSAGTPRVTRSSPTSNRAFMIVAIRFEIVTGSLAGAEACLSEWPITCPILSRPPDTSSGARFPQWSRPPLRLIC